MNRSSIACTALAFAIALYASDGRAQQTSPSPSTSPQTNPPSTTPPTRTPPTTTPGTQRQPSTSTQPGGTVTAESFVQEVAQDYQKEIEVSRLATTKAQSKDVKDYAKQLVDDHTKGLEKLRKYASEKSIALRTAAGITTDRPASTTGAPAVHNEPTAGGQGASAQMRELAAKSGTEFDKAYIQMMVDDHQKAVSLFERQHEAKLGDSELQSFISDQQGTLKKHLNKAKDIQKDLQKDTERDTSKTSAPGTKPLPSGAPAGAPTR